MVKYTRVNQTFEINPSVLPLNVSGNMITISAGQNQKTLPLEMKDGPSLFKLEDGKARSQHTYNI